MQRCEAFGELPNMAGGTPALPSEISEPQVCGGGRRRCDGRGGADGGRRQKPGGEDFLGEFLHFVGHRQERNGLQEVEPKVRHRFFSEGNFGEDNLRGQQFVLLAFQIPPVAGELLAGGLQKVTGGARNDVARYRAFHVDAHVVQFCLLVTGGTPAPPQNVTISKTLNTRKSPALFVSRRRTPRA